MITRLRDRLADRCADEPADAGFTLLEVVVGMTILVIFFAIFGASMISVYNSVRSTEQKSTAQGTVNQVFVKLDRQLRYASGVSQPASNVFETGDSVVEFVSVYSGAATCTELRLTAAGSLQERSWGQNDTSPVLSATSVLATQLGADTPTHPANVNTSVSGPFALIAAVGTLSNQRLEVSLNARLGGNTSSTKVRHFDVTFTAQNTGTSTTSNSVCSYGRRQTWPSP